VDQTLKALKTACEGEENLMPLIVSAVRVYATLGEICNVMRDVFGEYKENIVV
jgi:methylmalonyl-CoA mutase N-terminal domain/subunit